MMFASALLWLRTAVYVTPQLPIRQKLFRQKWLLFPLCIPHFSTCQCRMTASSYR